jgi:hypothetical protein
MTARPWRRLLAVAISLGAASAPRVQAIAFDSGRPGTAYAATAGRGLFRTTAGVPVLSAVGASITP